MYDWSDGGDTEVVVEDIERLNMDYFDKYDKQQKDWRMHNEVNMSSFLQALRSRIFSEIFKFPEPNWHMFGGWGMVGW